MRNSKWAGVARKTTIWAVLASFAFGATGCASVASRNAKEDYQSTLSQAREQAQTGYKARPATPLFSESNAFWVDKTPLELPDESATQMANLPPVFKQDIGVKFQSRTTLTDIMTRAERLSGLLFTISPDVYDSGTGSILSAAGSTSARPAARTGTAVTSPGARQVGSQAQGNPDIQVSDLIYKGAFSGMLDELAAKTNLSWRWDGERIVFYRYATRTFRIEALQGVIDSKSTVTTSSQASQQSSGSSGATSGVGGTSASGQDTSVDITNAIWSEIDKAVQGQLTANGKLALMPSAGTVTVTDTPQTLRAIGQYLQALNQSLSKQVMFNVEVYNVEVSDADNYGVDWNVVREFMSSKFNLSFSTLASSAATNTGTASSIPTGAAALTGGITSGPFSGSSAVFQALSSIGRTSLVSSASLMTMNNFTAPMNVVTEKAYLASVSTTVTGTASTSQTSLTPGLVTSGIMMNLTPRIMNGDRMLVQFSLDLSSLISIDSYTSGSSSIQVPTRSVRNFLQRVSMRSGQTLVLSGFQQTTSKNNTAGVGSPSNWGLGGSKAVTSGNTTLVVVVTPYIMKN